MAFTDARTLQRIQQGLAGMGDMIATCTSPQSRNRHVGIQLGLGRSMQEEGGLVL